MAITQVVSAVDQTLDQTTDTLVNGMTSTPVAGDYLVVFSGYLDHGATAKNYELSIYVGGVIVQHTERAHKIEASIATALVMSGVATHAYVSVNGSQTVEIRYRRTLGTTASTMKRRTMTLFPKASADFQQATATTNATISATTDTLLTGMSITPGAGTYLLVFSTSADNVAAGISLFHSVYVNNVQLAHTEREFWAEASISANLGAMPCLLACVVSPGAGQTVEIRSRRVTNNWTCYERTLTLMKVDAADIKEASATDVPTGTAITYESISATPLSITDPGVADWLAIFSTSHRYATITADQHTDFSIFNAGVQDVNTERRVSQGASIDDADYYGFCHGKITVAGATDDVDVRWKGATTTLRTAKERTLVMVREAAAGSVALTGSGGTSGLGTAIASIVLALSGVVGTGSVGTLTPSTATSVAITGEVATGGVGTLVPSVAYSVALAGASGTGAVGTLAASAAVALSGEAGTGGIGTLVPSASVNVAITGNQASGAAGAVAASVSVALSGEVAIGAVGSLTPSTGITLAIAGNAATGGEGSLAPTLSVALGGEGATGAVGTLGFVGLSGNAATGSVGGLSPSVGAALSGNAATGSVGTLVPSPAGSAGTPYQVIDRRRAGGRYSGRQLL